MILNKVKFYIGCLLILSCWNGQSFAADDEANAAEEKKAVNSSLRAYVKEENAEQNAEKAEAAKADGEENETWINNLVSTVAEKGAQVISSNPDNQSPQYRTNASVFNIAGVMLRMSTKETTEALLKHGYQKNSEKYEIPNFIRWRYDEQCRNQGVVGYERTEACVIKMAQQNKYQYIEQMDFNNFKTKENVRVFFTSNFTGNMAYRIVYVSEAANIRGTGAKADYLRNIKIYDFWKKINQKYGVPDNKEQVIWGLGNNKPLLQAATGRLMLYDPMLLDLDYTRMSREDMRFMNTDVYTF